MSRQAGRKIGRQIDRQVSRQAGRKVGRQTDRQSGKLASMRTGRQINDREETRALDWKMYHMVTVSVDTRFAFYKFEAPIPRLYFQSRPPCHLDKEELGLINVSRKGADSASR